MLCCVVLETSWITAVAGDEVLAVPKCGFGNLPQKTVDPKSSHQELNAVFNQRACLSKGMRPLGQTGQG
jgi:hypothetical protein